MLFAVFYDELQLLSYGRASLHSCYVFGGAIPWEFSSQNARYVQCACRLHITMAFHMMTASEPDNSHLRALFISIMCCTDPLPSRR